RIKEAEQDALSEALGFPVQPRIRDSQLAGQKEVDKAIKDTAEGDEEGGKGVGFGNYVGANGQQGDAGEIMRGHGGDVGGLESDTKDDAAEALDEGISPVGAVEAETGTTIEGADIRSGIVDQEEKILTVGTAIARGLDQGSEIEIAIGTHAGTRMTVLGDVELASSRYQIEQGSPLVHGRQRQDWNPPFLIILIWRLTLLGKGAHTKRQLGQQEGLELSSYQHSLFYHQSKSPFPTRTSRTIPKTSPFEMLPDGGFDTYISIKRDTNWVTNWLLSTASHCGHEIKQATGVPFSSTTKGKKNEKAKANEDRIEQSKVAVTVKDLKSTAERLLNSKATFDVPVSVVRAARRAVSARHQYSRYFTDHEGDVSVTASNLSHGYFTDTLRDILHLLERVYEKQNPIQPSSDLSRDFSSQDAANAFSRLAVHDTDEEDDENDGLEDHAAANVRPEGLNSEAAEADYPYTLEAPSDEWYFATLCLLMDVKSIERYISKLCFDVRDGKCSIAIFSVTANTAVDLVGRLLARFYDTCPQFAGSSSFLDQFHDELRQRSGLEPRPEGALSITPQGTFTYSVAREALKELRAEQCGKNLGHRDVFGDDVDVAAHDLALLRDILKDLTYLGTWCDSKGIPMLDRLTYLVADLCREAENPKFEGIPLHTAFAAKVFIQVHTILYEGRIRGWKELQIVARQYIKTLDRYEESGAARMGPSPTNFSERKRQELRTWIYDWIEKDIVRDTTMKFWSLGWIKSSDPIEGARRTMAREGFKALSQHPWLCGTIRFSLDAAMHEIGIDEWQFHVYGTSCSHIYNAALQEGFLEGPWTEIEKVLEMHPAKSVFYGTRPDSKGKYMSSWTLASFGSAQNFAKDTNKMIRQDLRVKVRKDNVARLVTTCPASVACVKQTHVGNTMLTYRPIVLESMLFNTEILARRSPHPKSSDIHLREIKRGDILQTKDDHMASRWTVDHRLLHPLHFVRESLREEEDGFQFPYLDLFQRCAEAAKAVNQEIKKARKDRKVLPEHQHSFPDGQLWANFLIDTAFLLEYFDLHTGKDWSPIVIAALKPLESMIRHNGDAACKKLQSHYDMDKAMAKKYYSDWPPMPKTYLGVPPTTAPNKPHKSTAVLSYKNTGVVPVSKGKADEKTAGETKDTIAPSLEKSPSKVKDSSTLATDESHDEKKGSSVPASKEPTNEKKESTATASRPKPSVQKKMAKGLADLY
ncbi:MAG: hypothetical protein Q9174_005242, partial [Haloplaca sp. 1 TL-2023]